MLTNRKVFAALVLAAVFAAGWICNGWRKDATISQMTADLAQERRDQALAQVKAVDDARLEEQRRVAAQVIVTNDAITQANQARADYRAADAARRELLARVAALANAARRPGDTAPAGGGATNSDPFLLLADVLGRADKRAGELAEALDASRIAGLACERSYDALIDGVARGGAEDVPGS